MKVSIIIPVYNVEQYLNQCIDSVLSQTYKNIEILLINDGSTDNSPQICKEYEQKNSNIKLINKENGGASDARNVGIMESTGDYIMFLDSDDFYNNDFLTNVMNYIQDKGNLDFIFFRYKCYYQKNGMMTESIFQINENSLVGKSGKECLKIILENNKGFKWYSWMYLLRRQFVLENQLFFEKDRYYEDILWIPQIFLKAKSIAYYDQPIYVYRLQRKGQITSTYSTFKNLNDSIYAASFWYKELNKFDVEKELKLRMIKNFADNYFVSIWYSGFLNKRERKKLFIILKENRNLLKYNNNLLSKFTAFLCNTIGFSFCSLFFKNAVILKRNLIVKRW